MIARESRQEVGRTYLSHIVVGVTRYYLLNPGFVQVMHLFYLQQLVTKGSKIKLMASWMFNFNK